MNSIFTSASAPLPSPELHALFRGLIRHLNLPEFDFTDALGLELVSGEFVVDVYPLGAEGTRLGIDVQIRELAFNDPVVDAQRFLFLHRLNDASRLADGWLATVNPEDLLVISRAFRVAELTPETLARAVADGLSRATEFAEGWTSLTSDLWAAAREQADGEPEVSAAAHLFRA